MKISDQQSQKGFSLFEVLIAMLVAAVGIASVMSVHTSNLRHVSDNAELNRGQLLLNNLVYRAQQSNDNGTLNEDRSSIQTTIEDQAVVAGLRDPKATINPNNNGQLLQLEWLAHDPDEAVVRIGCQAISIGSHCLSMWMAQQ